ncbi:hypothetical protein SERIO_v1c11320 [Spiroplasma eriocheiris]|uniref:Uncharacterized protein n=1 Tax=Spiroplasma eriocheiris TaxID=315358 RepID=A0A0H3XJC0_9MOLU|nr:hypothetical protein SERIO_v1c11320 [Spiroplasma eriocheiris]
MAPEPSSYSSKLKKQDEQFNIMFLTSKGVITFPRILIS